MKRLARLFTRPPPDARMPSRSTAPRDSADPATRYAPLPFVFAGRDLAVQWSAKSACSQVAIWAFHQERLLDAMSDYSGWPHRFRTEVYQPSDTVRRRLDDLLRARGAGFALIRITRNPAERMLSIFRHVCRHDFMDPAIAKHLGLDKARDGLSVRDFDALLSALGVADGRKVNIHLRPQASRLSELAFDRVVTLNMDTHALDPGLNAVEAAFALRPTSFDALPALQRLRASHYAQDAARPGTDNLADHRFRPGDTRSFPKRDLLATGLFHDLARRHHAVDTDSVASGDTDGEISFAPRPG